MVDKYEVREFVREKIGEDYLVPLYGVYETFDLIDFDLLPEKFVIKTTHDSGGVWIIEDKKNINMNELKKEINTRLKNNSYKLSREWVYKNVTPRIIIEKFLETENGNLLDYKFFAFDGRIEYMFVASDRKTNVKFDYFDKDFNFINLKQNYENSLITPEKPKLYYKMKEISEKLSKDIPHVRVDLYQHRNKIYFGELTFFHHGGFAPFNPEIFDYKLGSLIDLSKAYRNTLD